MLHSVAAPAASRPAFGASARTGRLQAVRPQAMLGGLLQKMGGGSPASTAAAKEEVRAVRYCRPAALHYQLPRSEDAARTAFITI